LREWCYRKYIKARSLSNRLDARENPWLDAWQDPCGGLKVFSSHLALCDATGVGEHMLIVADIAGHLKVYRNTDVHSTFRLLGVPSGVEVIWPDSSPIPALAVPCGNQIFLYRNLRPYYKFDIPSEEFDEEERAVWQSEAWNDTIPEVLLSVSEKAEISGRSKHLLSLRTSSEQEKFFSEMREVPFHKRSYCTCLASLPVVEDSGSRRSGGSCLVFGTETRLVCIMEQEANQIKTRVKIPAVPTLLAVSGSLNVSYRIFVAGRSNTIYIIKDGILVATTITVPAAVCALQVHLTSLYIACIDHRVYVRTFKGQVSGVLELPAAITAMAMFQHPNVQAKHVLLVGLKSGKVQMFVNKVLTHTLEIGDGIVAMKCGTYGRAESALIMVTQKGNLNIKLLKRNYDFNSVRMADLYPVEQDIPIELPKISKLYLEQTEREKQKALSMHRIFQGDILSLRVRVYENYAKVLREGLGPVSHHEKFKLGVEVLGLGPTFKLVFDIRNVGNQASYDMSIVLCLDDKNFSFSSNSIISIPVVVPEICYKYTATVKNINPDGFGSPIVCHLIDALHTQPVLSAIVEMPNIIAE